MSIRSYLPPPHLSPAPGGAPDSRASDARPSPLAAALNLLVLGLFGHPWMAFWLGLHPQARTPLAWAYYDEIATAPVGARWRRGLSFFAALPAAASAQSDAESNDATRTGGEPPEPPPTRAGSAGLLSVGRLLAALVGGVVFAFFAVITWLAVFAEMGDITNRGTPTSGSEIAALGLMLLVASAPVALFLFRRRFTWRRAHDARKPRPQRLGWIVVLIVFAVVAFVGWLGVTFENLDRLDVRSRHAFDDTLGLTIMALIAWLPLALLLWRRHWTGGSTTSEQT